MSILACVGMVISLAAIPPGDPDFEKQWNLDNFGQKVNGVDGVEGADIKALSAWNRHAGTRPVVVALIGAGVNPHEEFADRLLPGYVSSLAGGDPFSTLDVGENGTRAAGIIAAKRDNGIGIAGINDQVRILPVRVASDSDVSAESVAEGLVWAVDHGADIALVLIQFYEGAQVLADAVAYANSNDVLVVAPAGHDGAHTIAFPAAYENCLAVSATNHRDEIAAFSNAGIEVDLSAPGESIWSTIGVNQYGYGNGGDTFGAAAHVAGVASLMRSYSPSLSAAQIRLLLLQTADDLGEPGFDEHFGAGRLNADQALEATPMPLLRIEPLAAIPTTIPPLQTVSFPIRVVNGTGTLNPTSPELVYRTQPGPFANSIRMQSLGGNSYSAILPSLPCDTSIDFYMIAGALSGLTVTDPAHAPAELHHLEVDPDVVIFDDDFEEDLGWETAVGGAGTTGAWIRAEPTGTTSGITPVQPEYDRTEDLGDQCFFTGQHVSGSIGSNDVDLGPVVLISPVINVGQNSDIEVRFASWVYSNIGTPDSLTMEFSRDAGATWTTGVIIPNTFGWIDQSVALDLFPSITGSQLRVRFTISDIPSDSLTEAAVDDFEVVSRSCAPVQGDINGDGIVNLRDMGNMGGCLSGPSASRGSGCIPADLNADSHVDLRDVSVLYRSFH